jgi:hypothetical protein
MKSVRGVPDLQIMSPANGNLLSNSNTLLNSTKNVNGTNLGASGAGQ